MNPRNLAAMAHHEAAHILVGLDTPYWWFHDVIVVPDGRAAGWVLVPGKNKGSDGRACGSVSSYAFSGLTGYDKLAIVALAGPHGQRRFAPRSQWRSDARGDYRKARALIKKLGLTGKRATTKFAELDALAAQAVADNWPDITKVAGALLKKHRLTYDEVCHDVLGRPRLFRKTSGWSRPLIYGPPPGKQRARR